jgi:starch synthase
MANILFAINEATPIYKIGGLGDVGGSLPKNLLALGVDVRLIMPLHPEIKLHGKDIIPVETFSCIYDHLILEMTVYETFLPNTKVPVYLLKENHYLSEHTGYSDNDADKYAVFSLGIASWIAKTKLAWRPDIVHLNDWHTALVPLILKHLYQYQLPTLLTIHNLAYQGMTKTKVIQKLDLDPTACQIIPWDHKDGDLNILLEGITHADYVNTVSSTYAKEILTPEYGAGLEEVLLSRQSRLSGITNGLDTDFFNPQTDTNLEYPYSLTNALTQKKLNKQSLITRLGLVQTPEMHLVGYVGRVDGRQKGIDLIIDALVQKLLPAPHSQFVFLGTGEPSLETALRNCANSPSVKIITRFDEPLAHQLYAASDLLLIPSRYEPCGLIQLIAMRYGSLPVARRTGGLADTINHDQTGFLFPEYSVSSMMACLTQSLTAITDPPTRQAMVNAAMSQNFSWFKNAALYLNLYHQLIDDSFPGR